MLIEILSLTAILIFLLMAFIAWIDRSSGNGRFPVLFVQQKKEGKIDKALLKAFNSYSDKDRFFLFWLQMQRINKTIPQGSMAELGVYQGDSARLLHLMAPNRVLHLFDTFEGFREADLSNETGEAGSYKSHHFADTSIGQVKNKLGNHPNIQLHKGNFAAVCHKFADEQFAFVSIDVDLARPTDDGIRFFYPRLLPGGVMIIHDYNPKWRELMHVVDVFLSEIPERPVLASDKDTSLIIVKNR
ncbi:MAG: class I SAM-dependent methyltransferase [Bacteroidetes bacterium]|jgi:O-methyltransferase|nr:class I SAM-dependent methyltransferase [Bacteroidota bacterium]